MNEWGSREWYPVLMKGKGLILVGDWVLYRSGSDTVELVHHSGAMCRAEVEEDGVCRVRAKPEILPLPEEVVAEVSELLNLT